jgi:hypothetical protein
MKFLSLALTLTAWPALALPPVAESGFETPVIQARTALSSGADITESGSSVVWVKSFNAITAPEEGKVELGLTNEVAHSGKQCLYLSFTDVAKKYMGAYFTTKPLPVESGGRYRVNLWLKGSETKPIEEGIGGKVSVAFLAADKTTKVGKLVYLPISASVSLYSASAWTEYSESFAVPDGASFAYVNCAWQTLASEKIKPAEVFIDDFSLIHD